MRSTSARPGRSAIAGALVARGLGVPLIGSYHTELTAYAALRSGDPGLAQAMDLAVRTLYGACDLVLSPSPSSDETLEQLGIPAARIARWDRGVDCSRFDPALRGECAAAGRAQRPLQRAHHAREGGRLACRRVSRRTRARPAAAPRAGRRRPRGEASARAPRRRAPPSSAGRRARSWRRCMRAPTSSCSPAPPTPSGR